MNAPAIGIPLCVPLFHLLLPDLKEQAWTPLRLVGAVLAVCGCALVLTARVQLGKSFSVRPKAEELVTKGLYARIRNPMYVFLDLTVFGLILALQWYWLFVVLAALVVLQARQARREAKVLQERFGQAYVDYRKRTWL
jgi:protein-S-isoprenylcysteine O-methyltransferase Ste14